MERRLDDLEQKLAAPMENAEYAGYVERMGRHPDRFDYLYEAAFAHCYAAWQSDPAKKAAVQKKAKQYYEVWQRSQKESRREDFYARVPDLAGWMIQRYQQILDYDPDHPLKADMLSAIKELEEFRKKKE